MSTCATRTARSACAFADSFVARSRARTAQARETTGAGQAVTSLLLPRWDAVARPFVDAWPALSTRLLVVGGSAGQQQALRQHYAHTQVLDAAEGSTIDTLVAALSAHESFDHVVWIAAPLLTAPDEEQLIDAQEHGVIALFRFVKALLANGYGARALGWTVLTTQSQQIDAADVVHPAHAGIHGFVGSLAKEYAHWPVRLVDLPAGEHWRHRGAAPAARRIRRATPGPTAAASGSGSSCCASSLRRPPRRRSAMAASTC